MVGGAGVAMVIRSLAIILFSVCVLVENVEGITLSSRLIHRFSEEMRELGAPINGSLGGLWWPERKSMDYYQILVSNDFQRQKMKLRPQFQLLVPSEGSTTMSFGNDFGWLHYTWIDIGTPKVSFLVALDAGSDLLWVPCECIQCAPLSASYYNSLDRDLNEYNPSGSSTSKHLSCSHQLCDSGPNCKTPKQSCPYTIKYFSKNTSSSGFLVEDTLHLASAGDNDASNSSIRVSVIIGCGMKQTGGYLDGIAPDGLLGLGLGEISVPTLLAKAGFVRNSFSMCFDDEDNGKMFFGDQGPAIQQYTPFLPLNGKYVTYIIGVEAFCVESSCPKQTGFNALVDSGTSFTFLPDEVYETVAEEFDRQVNATRRNYESSLWKYCYNYNSQAVPIPSLKLAFSSNNSFVVHNSVIMIYGNQGVEGFCLALQPTDGDLGTLGQNFMTGYRMVFDRENMKLGWSRVKCQDISDGDRLTPNGRPSNPLPTNQQQSSPSGYAVAPAVAGKAPSKSSSSSTRLILSAGMLRFMPLLLLITHPLVSPLSLGLKCF